LPVTPPSSQATSKKGKTQMIAARRIIMSPRLSSNI